MPYLETSSIFPRDAPATGGMLFPMVMLAPSATASQAERPHASPAWARLPLERAARYSLAEDATSSFPGSTGVNGTYLDEVLMMRNSAGTKL